jgi:uncharacterized protein YcbX
MRATVAALWRYPVKSMLGEDCEHLIVDARGVEGDRLFAVRDADGKLGSGKTTRRFRRLDGLLEYRATADGDRARVTFPDGRSMAGDDPDIGAALSAALGSAVTLAREDRVSHFDVAPLHLLTTAALAWLRGRLSGARVDERRFRPNVLIELPGDTQVEREWLGRILCIGTDVRLRVRDATERCVMVGLAQANLPDDGRILRTIAQEADARFGVYADVVQAGTIRRGDPVRVRD